MNLKRGNSSAQPLVVKVKYEILPVSCREVHDVDVSGTLAGLGGGADHYVFAVGRSDTGVPVRQREEKDISGCQFWPFLGIQKLVITSTFSKEPACLYQEH
jgi:hypothetical protein